MEVITKENTEASTAVAIAAGFKLEKSDKHFRLEPETTIFTIPANDLGTEDIEKLISMEIENNDAWYPLCKRTIKHDELGGAPKHPIRVKYVRILINNDNGFVNIKDVHEAIIKTGIKPAPAIFFMICENDNLHIPQDADKIISLERTTKGKALHFNIHGFAIDETNYVHANDHVLCIVEG